MLVLKPVIFLLSLIFCGLVFANSTHEIATQKVTNKPVSSSEKERIRVLQKKLSREGYYSGTINGEKTLETRRAIKNWASDRD